MNVNDINIATDEPKQAMLYVQADDTLNKIRESLLSRAATIEGEMKRLHDELQNVNHVLSRVAPPAPSPMNVYQPGSPVSSSPLRNW